MPSGALPLTGARSTKNEDQIKTPSLQKAEDWGTRQATCQRPGHPRDFSGNNITRFDPKTKEFVEYPIPTHGAYPRFIGLDSKGRVWFGEWWNSKLGMLDPEGSQQMASR